MKNTEYRKRSKQKSEIEKIYERLKVIQQNSVLMEYIEKENIELLVTLGAGDIDRFVGPIAKMLSER